MGTSVFLCLFVSLLTRGSPAGCAGGEDSSASHSTASTAEKPILLNNIADTEAFISGAEVAVIGFFQTEEEWKILIFKCRLVSVGSGHPEVGIMWWRGEDVSVPAGGCLHECLWRGCWEERTAATGGVFACLQIDNDRRDVDMNGNDVDAEKMTRFIRMNELRLVTEYNPVTAIGVMQSSLQLHLLLITDKMSPKHPEHMRRYRAAAELFRGKILFILIDSNLKSNERIVSFFKLKKSQLPALAMFHAPDEEQDVLTLDEVSVEHIQDFCNRFLQRMQKKEDEPEEKALSEEL
ncbi:endoplasmic reticulum resident protein 27 [Athene cunicularia]|nr:endoplasmic reticulum resident protein 27 [Athene cunicularia]